MNSTSTIAHQKTEQTENIESRIIEAAKQEFIKKGFEQTSMSDIAAVVGINRPTLHYYFRTNFMCAKLRRLSGWGNRQIWVI